MVSVDVKHHVYLLTYPPPSPPPALVPTGAGCDPQICGSVLAHSNRLGLHRDRGRENATGVRVMISSPGLFKNSLFQPNR